MATQVNESFTVSDPDPDQAWGVVSDVSKLVPCVPGAKVLSAEGPTKATAEIDVKIGSMGMKFSGPAEDAPHPGCPRGRALESATPRDAAGRRSENRASWQL